MPCDGAWPKEWIDGFERWGPGRGPRLVLGAPLGARRSAHATHKMNGAPLEAPRYDFGGLSLGRRDRARRRL